MLTYAPNVQLILDLAGIFVFGLSGGLVAVKKRLDLFGVLVLAAAAALGGGILRDVLLGIAPPVGISDWRLLGAAALAGLVTFFYHPNVERISHLVRVLDAGGLAAFAVAGTLKAIGAGVGFFGSVVIGGITAIGGGVIRDLLADQVPEVLRRELYAVPALLGALAVATAHRYNVLGDLTVWASVALVFVIRIAAVALDLNAPRPLRSGDHT